MIKSILHSRMAPTLFLVSALSFTLNLAGCGSSAKKPDSSKASNGGASGVAQDSTKSGDEVVDDSSPADVPSLTSDGSKTAANLDPKYKTLAQAIHSGHSRAVTEQASKILGANAYDPTALNALALLHLKKGHTGAAKLLLNKALERSNTAGLSNNLGIAYMVEGDESAALTNFKKALKADPNNQQALGNLGSLYLKGGDVTRALPLLEQSFKASPSNLSVANNYAIALRLSGDLDGAGRLYDSILKVDPKNVYALLNEAILMVEFQSKPKDGLTLVYKLKFLETDRKDVLARANALEKKAKAGLQ
jgi:Flp pilus assembly protein TadD